jgi:hypothetical protein
LTTIADAVKIAMMISMVRMRSKRNVLWREERSRLEIWLYYNALYVVVIHTSTIRIEAHQSIPPLSYFRMKTYRTIYLHPWTPKFSIDSSVVQK